MRLAIYPGSFNPFHKGHFDILNQASKLFDKVIVARPKGMPSDVGLLTAQLSDRLRSRVHITEFDGLLVNFAKIQGAIAIIRGLRNTADLDYEKSMQYWNEDLGLTIPTVYFICSRELVHVSSSAIRTINKLTDPK